MAGAAIRLCQRLGSRVSHEICLNFSYRSMVISAESISDKLKDALEATSVAVVDTSGGCGASFRVEVVAEKFAGMKLIQRHRAINEVLKEELAEIHALQISKCQTPDQAQNT